jgi:preprotein translocase subunit YajC
MWIASAYAQEAAQQAGGGTDIVQQLMPLVLIFVVFYFLLIRPQQKKVKEHQGMLDNLRRGDKVVTSGGIVGKIVKLGADGDRDIEIEIAENVRIKVMKSAIAELLTKPEPAGKDGDGKAAENDNKDGGGSMLGKLLNAAKEEEKK